MNKHGGNRIKASIRISEKIGKSRTQLFLLNNQILMLREGSMNKVLLSLSS